jgi:hypothetical protein
MEATRKTRRYRIHYYRNGQKESVRVDSAKKRDGIIQAMKSGRWSDTYENITWKRVAK